MNSKFLNKVIFILFLFFVFGLNFKNNVLAENSLYEIRAKKVTYNDNNNLIIATGSAEAIDQFGKEIFSNEIIYNKKKSTIKTNGNSIYLDGKGNRLFANTFFYDINAKVIKANKDVQYIDVDENVFKFTYFEYNESSENGIGENLIANFKDESSAESRIAKIDNKNGFTTMLSSDDDKKKLNFPMANKNFYTTCKNLEESAKTIEQRCADWSITSQKTLHDKNKRMLYHNNSVVKLRNIPVFYTPYFSHPDPSVKRMSGFLPPSTKNFENLGRTIKTPYFWAIDDNRDLTFTPILYLDENSIFLSEYRQQNKESNFYIDTSYSQGYKKLEKKDSNGNAINRTAGSRNHLFFGFAGKYKNLLLEKNDLNINIQRISQKNYLKVNQINTAFVKEDDSSLKNNIRLNSYTGNKRIEVEAAIYESLATEARNKKYNYTVPSIKYWDFFRKGSYNFNFSNSIVAQNLEGDSSKSNQINEINLATDQKVYRILDGVSHVFKSSLSNINSYNQNVLGEKENLSSDGNIIFGLENTYPLVKYSEDFTREEILTPKIFSKYTPGDMNNVSNSGKVISYGDVYSMNRIGLSNPDSGISLGYGLEYETSKKNQENQVYMNGKFALGQVLRGKKLKQMPSTSTLGETKSDFVGEASFNFDRNKLLYTDKENKIEPKNEQVLKINYNYILNNNLNKILKTDFLTSYGNKKNEFNAQYYETHDVGNQHYADFNYTRKFDNLLNISVGVRKNFEKEFTESNYINLFYDSDCLTLGLSLAKKFYSNSEVKKSNNFILSIALKPFGSPIAPNLTDLVN